MTLRAPKARPRKRILDLLTQAQLAASQGPDRARPSPLVDALSRQCSVPAVDVRHIAIADDVWHLVSVEIAELHVCVPLSRTSSTLTIAMADPTNLFAIDDLKFLTGYDIAVVVADDGDVRALIAARKERLAAGGARPPGDVYEDFIEVVPPLDDAEPVEKLATLMLCDALKRNASEIVVEPRATELVVSYLDARDAVLHTLLPPLKLARVLGDVLGRVRGVTVGLCEADVDTTRYPTRFGEQVSVRLFKRHAQPPLPLPAAWCALDGRAPLLPRFASALRVEPEPGACGHAVVFLLAAHGWRPTWTYPMSRHADVVAVVRKRSRDDDDFALHEDECAAGVRLFLRKRS